MPIIGLTDQRAALPQIGTLRKGSPKTDKKPGTDLGEFFRFDSTDADALAAFESMYTDKPKSIRVFIPYDSIDQAFDSWNEAYTAGAMQHRCDGKTCVLSLQNGRYSSEPIPCPGGCKATGRLRVLIPELGRRAIVMVLTTSIHDIVNIHANLLDLEEATGSLKGIPLILRRVEKAISVPGPDGKRVRRNKWLIQIEPQRQWVELQLRAQQEVALSGIRAQLNPAPIEAIEEEEAEEESPALSVNEPLPLYGEGLGHWVASGQPAAKWDAWYQKWCGGKSLDQIQGLYLQKWPPITEPEAVEAEIVSPDDLLATVERLIVSLKTKTSEAEVEAKLKRLTSGEPPENCTAEVLAEIIDYLADWEKSLEKSI